MPNFIKIRKLSNTEAKLLKTIRLKALLDSPNSFGSEYKNEKQKNMSYWQEILNKSESSVTYLAFQDKKEVGMIWGFLRENKGVVGIGGMWVDPNFRNKGIGKALIQSVLEWAKKVGVNKVTLWNRKDNLASKALYEKMGFRFTENEMPLREGSRLKVQEMELELKCQK